MLCPNHRLTVIGQQPSIVVSIQINTTMPIHCLTKLSSQIMKEDNSCCGSYQMVNKCVKGETDCSHCIRCTQPEGYLSLVQLFNSTIKCLGFLFKIKLTYVNSIHDLVNWNLTRTCLDSRFYLNLKILAVLKELFWKMYKNCNKNAGHNSWFIFASYAQNK